LIAILVAIWLFRASLVSAIREFIAGLRSWWAGLFGGSSRSGAGDASLAGGTTMAPPPAWRDFVNPFSQGMAQRVPAGELIRYTFAALDAWARECGQSRGIHETPLEFARRLGTIDEQFGREALAVAELYGQLAFARESLPAHAVETARKLWQRLTIPSAAAATV